MEIKQNIKIAVDAIVFGYSNNSLKVLLVKQKFGELKDSWVLVGGFVKDEESLQTAVRRELKEEAGIEVNYLEQLYTFGDDVHRDPRGRVVSVAFFALVDPTKLDLSVETDTDAHDARWFPIHEIPRLGFDHNQIVELAYRRLQNKLTYQPIGFGLLPEEFLFSELENLYSTILEHDIERRNFRKKILSFGIVEETELISTKNGGRPAKLFRFNSAKYKELEKEGLLFEIKLA